MQIPLGPYRLHISTGEKPAGDLLPGLLRRFRNGILLTVVMVLVLYGTVRLLYLATSYLSPMITRPALRSTD